ncbi:PHP domain-containing protein [Aceticella autotrophica]|uniref:PHP domain-containing protein n=1 Tax=Aceticella autotrophica TaxID=2755338 RepID=A0A975AU56_9THEO|nr:PHP domain-containing protein [Aceticella autotrophica]QSZ26385.1 PHP domain-containing protein [Aceticella autotrophica]
MFADLHIHSTASDGTNSPSKIVKLAKEKGLNTISLTDHDTVDGIEEALKKANELNIEIIPGIELNSNDGEQEVHILGYFINYKNNKLKSRLKKIIDSRIVRANTIIEKLNNLNISITMKDVLEFANEKFIGRPHIARAMIKKNYVKTVKEAFEKYIGEGGPAYVPRTYRLYPQDSIKYIIEAGGIPVLAHPVLLKNKNIIGNLMNNGLKGIEVYHSKQSSEESEYYYKFALENNLLITGGSDFHGIEVDGKDLLGTIKLDYKYVELLKEFLKSMEII